MTFAATGIGVAISHGLLTGPVVSRIGERATLIGGLLIGAVGFTLYGISWDSWVVWAAIPLIALWGLAESAMQSLMSAEVTASEQGRLQGALASLVALAETLGPVLFTTVYAAALRADPTGTWAGAPFLVAACLQIIAVGFAYGFARRNRKGS
jgi:MFS transporter, DHA1 family, tetracycline resistance protein